MAEVGGEGLDAIVINTSGCGTTVKDYGHMLAAGPLAEDAATVEPAGGRRDRAAGDADARGAGRCGPNPARRAIAGTDAPPEQRGAARMQPAAGLRVAYHAACSLQHGQKVRTQPKALLKAAGFEVVEPRDSHLCCGSAGTYNLMQPAISAELRRRKVATIEAVRPQVDRRRQHRLHDADRLGRPGSRWCTRSSCSTGRPEARGRAALGGGVMRGALLAALLVWPALAGGGGAAADGRGRRPEPRRRTAGAAGR